MFWLPSINALLAISIYLGIFTLVPTHGISDFRAKKMYRLHLYNKKYFVESRLESNAFIRHPDTFLELPRVHPIWRIHERGLLRAHRAPALCENVYAYLLEIRNFRTILLEFGLVGRCEVVIVLKKLENYFSTSRSSTLYHNNDFPNFELREKNKTGVTKFYTSH